MSKDTYGKCQITSNKVVKENVIKIMKEGIPERKAVSYAGMKVKVNKPLKTK